MNATATSTAALSTALTTESAPKNIAHMGAAPGSVLAIIPQTMDEVWRFAQVLAKSGLCPYGMDTPEKVSVAILTGLELGVKPMQAVQGIAVIGGRPCIWGDLSLGLVRANPELEYVVETYDGVEPEDWGTEAPSASDRKYKAVCKIKRRNQPEVIREYSIGDAVVAKLWQKRGYNGKDTPWVTGPKRMLQMRARAFALRDLFTDVLKGLYIAEELIGTDMDNDNNAGGFAGRPALIAGPDAPEDDAAAIQAAKAAHAAAPRVEPPPVTAKKAPPEEKPGPDLAAAPEKVAEAEIVETEAQADEETFDPIVWTDEAVARFGEAQSAKVVDEIHACFEETASELPRDQALRYQEAHEAAMERHKEVPAGGPVNLGEVEGPDAPDDDFPGNDAITALRTGQTLPAETPGQDGPQGEGDDDYDGFSEAGIAFDQEIQAILDQEGRTHVSLAEAFNGKLQQMADLMADGDLPEGYDKETRETFAHEWQRLKNIAKEKVGGTGDEKADALTERLREGINKAQTTDELNAFVVSTLPERNSFGSKHPLYSVWQDMIKSRRKALSALAAAA